MKKLLTKTDFILYRECDKNVWIKWHKPDEYKNFPVSEFEVSLGEMGLEVEKEAQKRFPGGFSIGRRSEGAQELTKKLIKEHTKIIFQAVFSTEKYLAATDVLKWNEKANAYDIYEIKMSSTKEVDDEETDDGKPKKINTSRELQYEYDLAFQTNVAKLCGVNFNKKYLLRLNKEYIKKGELDPVQLFAETDKTEAINDAFQSATLAEMEGAHLYLSNDKMPAGNCKCYYKGRSRHCTTFSLSNPKVPDYSVHDLNRIGSSKPFLKDLLDRPVPILKIDDVPEHEIPKPSKTKDGKPGKPRKLNQVRVYKSEEPIVDYVAIKQELDSLTFPLYFLDYETYPTALPIFDGYHPYQHIVFQYSLHILRSKDSIPEHEECLILDGDPVERIATSLRKHIGNVGSIISWSKFENTCNRKLKSLVPSQSEFLEGVIKRTYDLRDIVENQYYVHHGFQGSSSIKEVQSVLAKKLNYKKLAIQNGMGAIEAYRQIFEGEVTGKDIEEKRKQMLEYCGYDTEVMYIIWKFFSGLVEQNNTR